MENTTIGELLKSSREAQNLSLKEVSQKTKININILRHLEANRISELPYKTYVRGFVKTYAKLVGIADQDAISSLDFTYGDLSGSEKLFAPKIQEEDEEKAKKEETKDIQNNIKSIVSSMIDKRVLYGIATIVLIVLIGKAVGSFFNQLSNEQVKMVKKEKVIEPKAEVKKVTDTSVESKSTDKEKKDKEAKLAKEKSDKEKKEKEAKLAKEKKEKEAKLAKEKANKEKKDKEAKLAKEKSDKEKKEKEAKLAKEKTDKKEEKKKVVNLNGKFPKVDFYPAPTRMFSIVKDAKENSDTSILPARFKNAVEKDKENVYIRAVDGATWISYQSDEEKIRRFVLKEGRSVLIKGKKILLFMGNVNVARIFYNNQLIKAPTKSGVKSLIFPQSEAQNHELPLFPSYKGVPYKADVYKANMQE